VLAASLLTLCYDATASSNIISSHCLDDADIFNRRNCMIGQVNSVLCYFGKLPSSVKSKLLYAYCSSLYGCERWDLWNKNIDTVCVAWRKALRRVWNLPFNAHCDILFELSNALPVYDVICKRVLAFITKCVHSDCYIVKAVARHAILHGHMTSPIGRSALYCGLRFKFDIGRLLDPRFDYCNLVWNNYLFNVSAELLANVSVLKDFLLFRNKPALCSDMFNTDDITCFITTEHCEWLFGFHYAGQTGAAFVCQTQELLSVNENARILSAFENRLRAGFV